MAELGYTRQTPIVIDDDDDCVPQPFRVNSNNISGQGRVGEVLGSALDLKANMSASNGWVRHSVSTNLSSALLPSGPADGGADMQVETGLPRETQAQLIGSSIMSDAPSLKRKRNDEDTESVSCQMPRAFEAAASGPVVVSTPVQLPGSVPFTGLSKTQRKKLRKRQRAEELAVSRAGLLPVPMSETIMLPAEAILGYSAQHRASGPYAESTFNDASIRSGPSFTGPATLLGPSVQPQPAPLSFSMLSERSMRQPMDIVNTVADTSVLKPSLQEASSRPHYLEPVPIQPPKPPAADFSKNLFGPKSRVAGSFAPAGSGHGLFPLTPDQYVPHAPECTLIMESMPKKFRTLEFVLQWCKDTGTEDDPPPLHIDVTRKLGKALIEFKSRERAIRAFNSPKLINKDGREQITLYWYRPRGLEPSLSLPIQPPQPLQAPPAIPPPPPSVQTSRRPPSPDPPVNNVRLAENVQDDMEEGEISEVPESNERHTHAYLNKRGPASSSVSSTSGGHNRFTGSNVQTSRRKPWGDTYSPPRLPTMPAPLWMPGPNRLIPSAQMERSHQWINERSSSVAAGGAPAPLAAPRADEIPSSKFEHILPMLESREEFFAGAMDGSLALAQSESVESSLQDYSSLAVDVNMDVDTQQTSGPAILTDPFGGTHALSTSRDVPLHLQGELATGRGDRVMSSTSPKLKRGVIGDDASTVVQEAGFGTPTVASKADVIADRLSELRQRVLASKKKRREPPPASIGAGDNPSALPPSPKRPSTKDIVAVASTTPFTSSTNSFGSSDSLFSKLSSNSSISSASAPSTTPDSAPIPKSASYFDNLATAFLQDIIGTAQSSPAADADSSSTTTERVPIDSKTVLQNKQKRLEQHIVDMRQLMGRLGSALTKAEKDEVMSNIRLSQRTFDAENAAADAALKRMATAVRTKATPSILWPRVRQDQLVLLVSDSEDDACDSGDDG